MSLKARFRRIEAGVRWLETEGVFRNIEAKMKLIEMRQEISDYIASNPAAAERWNAGGSGGKLPPPARPPAKPPDKPAPLPDPKPALVPQTPPANVESASSSPPPPPPQPSVIAAPPAAVVKTPRPRPPDPPAPLPGMPVSLPSPDMEIRPVRWRAREARDDDEEDRPGTNGKCITEYDPLADEDDDYDYDDDDDDDG